MKILPFNDYPSAQAANASALALLQATQGAIGSQWSDIYTDGTRFAILYDDAIAPAFDAATLGSVFDADPTAWASYVPPQPPPPDSNP